MKNFNAVALLRFTARTWGLVICVLAGMTLISDGFGIHSGADDSAHSMLSFLAFPLIVCIGLMWGWKNEFYGGALASVGFVIYLLLESSFDYFLAAFVLTPSLTLLVLGWPVFRDRNKQSA